MNGSCPERSGQHCVRLYYVRLLRAKLLSPCFIDRAITAASPMFTGIKWEDRQEEWVGSRPCTTHGLQLVGATRSKRVNVAGDPGGDAALQPVALDRRPAQQLGRGLPSLGDGSGRPRRLPI